MRTPLNKSLAVLVTTGLAGFGLVGLTGTSGASVDSPLVYGLTETNQIVQFNANTPGTLVGSPVQVTVAGDLEAIDIRPATGELYGLLNTLTGADALVVIDPNTGAVVRNIPLTPGPDQSVTPAGTTGNTLEGDEFAFDFNPQIDRIRVVSNTDDNYVLNPNTGAIQAKQPDVRRVGDATSPDVRGAAYTNNVATQTATTTATTLFDIDIEGADFLRTQSAAGATSGELTAVGPLTGADVPTAVTAGTGAAVGFDIEAGTDRAFAVLERTTGVDEFNRINLQTGAASPIGTIGGTTLVEDITIASPRISVTGSTSGTEGGTASITLTRTGDLDDEITVPLSATNTATTTATTADVVSLPSAVFAPRATQTVVTFSLRGSDGVEGDEILGIQLGRPNTPNAAVTRNNLAFVTITDDGRAADGFAGGGTGGGANPGSTGSPSPSASASASPSASGSASPSTTASARPSANPARLGITVSPGVITPGVASVVRVTGTPGSVIELRAYSRPSTTYVVVRRGTIPSSGVIEFRVTPGTNTRLFAAVTGVANTESPSIVINVRTALSLTVVRNGRRNYTFQGRILPRRAGQLISLYRVTNSGQEILTSQLRTDNTGTYRINRRFTGSGTFGFLTRTGQTLTNAAGVSNNGRPRPTAIF